MIEREESGRAPRRWPKALAVLLSGSLLLLAILTASLHGLAASYAKEAELLYRRSRAMEAELGEMRADVRRLKSPSEVEARLAAMREGKKPESAKAPKRRPGHAR